METENIKKFMQLHYSDEKLAALLAHAEDGKLAYKSCCCFIGTLTANHALLGLNDMCGDLHLTKARQLAHGQEAEREYFSLGGIDAEWEMASICDARRRAILIPLIKEEMARRAAIVENFKENSEITEGDTVECVQVK